MDSDSIIEEWTKRGIIKEKVFDEVLLVSDLYWKSQHQKVVVRHIWKDALDICEDIRHQSGMKERYQHRKETIERLFGTAKEYHNLRYTREKRKRKVQNGR